MNLEDYILDLLRLRELQLKDLRDNHSDYSTGHYLRLEDRYQGAINDLTMCLTAWNNPLSQASDRLEEFKKSLEKKRKK